MPGRGSGCPGDLVPPSVSRDGPVSRGARPHSLDLQRGGLNLHLHLVGGTREQLDGAVLAEALPVHLVENRAVVRLDAQGDGEAHEARQVSHGWGGRARRLQGGGGLSQRRPGGWSAVGGEEARGGRGRWRSGGCR